MIPAQPALLNSRPIFSTKTRQLGLSPKPGHLSLPHFTFFGDLSETKSQMQYGRLDLNPDSHKSTLKQKYFGDNLGNLNMNLVLDIKKLWEMWWWHCSCVKKMFSFSMGSWEVHYTVLSTFYEIFHTLKKKNKHCKSDHIVLLLRIFWYSLLPRNSPYLKVSHKHLEPCLASFSSLHFPRQTLLLGLTKARSRGWFGFQSPPVVGHAVFFHLRIPKNLCCWLFRRTMNWP